MKRIIGVLLCLLATLYAREIVDMSGKPKEICGNLTLLSPTSATISRWLRDRKDGIAGSVDLLLKFD